MVPQLFHPLVEQACAANPLVFNIPIEMQRYEIMPGMCYAWVGGKYGEILLYIHVFQSPISCAISHFIPYLGYSDQSACSIRGI